MCQRRADVCAHGLPFLVAERDGELVGYGYASLYRPRPAYRFTVEDSVYVREDMSGLGVGQALLSRVIERCIEDGRWLDTVIMQRESGEGAGSTPHG
ncbi:N-acyltransferase YncA [compost metagenome]